MPSSSIYVVASGKIQFFFMGFPTQTVKNLPAMQETQLWSLAQEDPLEKEMATHSNILAWKTPRTEESGGLQWWGHEIVLATE